MEKLLNAELEGQIKEVFQGITDPVVALFFGSKLNNCNYCQDTLADAAGVGGFVGQD